MLRQPANRPQHPELIEGQLAVERVIGAVQPRDVGRQQHLLGHHLQDQPVAAEGAQIRFGDHLAAAQEPVPRRGNADDFEELVALVLEQGGPALCPSALDQLRRGVQAQEAAHDKEVLPSRKARRLTSMTFSPLAWKSRSI